MIDLATVRKDLDPESKETDQALGWLRDVFQITDERTLNQAGTILIKAKVRFKELEAKRKELTQPLLAVKRGIDDLFKPVTTALEQTEAILKQKIGAYTVRVEEERRALMTESAAQYQAGRTPTAMIPEPAKTAGVSVRFVWDFEVTDPDQVPRFLCSPDVRKIGTLLDSMHGEISDVPGLRFFQRDQVSARTKP